MHLKECLKEITNVHVITNLSKKHSVLKYLDRSKLVVSLSMLCDP